jgi:UPF0716 protein FxsA
VAVRRGSWLPLAALALFLTEAVVFTAAGEAIGFGWAVLVVALASLLGLVLVRREGMRAWHGFQRAVAAGQPPGPRVSDGLVGLAGALLLAIPGLVTGAAGALLLAPPVRGLASARVRARAERRMSPAAANDVFGPRWVRVRPDRSAWPEAERPGADVVEGEVLDPARQPRPEG